MQTPDENAQVNNEGINPVNEIPTTENLDTPVSDAIENKEILVSSEILETNISEKNAEIAVDQVRTISKLRLQNKIDSLSNTKAAQLRKLITDMYGE